MSRRSINWLAWGLFVLSTGAIGVSFSAWLLEYVAFVTPIEIAGNMIFVILLPVTSALVGTLIVSRYPKNVIGWLLMIPAGGTAALAPVQPFLTEYAPSNSGPSLMLLTLAWLNSVSWMLLIFPLLQIALRFPNGRTPTVRWRWLHRAILLWSALLLLMAILSNPIDANGDSTVMIDNRFGVLPVNMGPILTHLWIAGLATLMLFAVASLIVRYRRAGDAVRHQIKWLLLSGAVLTSLYTASVGGLGAGDRFGDHIFTIVYGLSATAVPTAIGVAIFRYHLYDIDRIINRALVYGSLSACLIGTYIGVVLLFQQLFHPLTGSSDLTIAFSTLAVAALFSPARRRIQNLVDRRFYRQKYDAEHALSRFGLTVRDQLDLEQLTGVLASVISETVQPEHLSVWLRDSETAQ